MGLLPIFLTLTAFIFLWGLVNYNSFVAQQARINGLRETEVSLQERLREIVKQLSTISDSAAAPGCMDASNPAAPEFPAELAGAWRRFAETHPSQRDRAEVAPLLNELEEIADGQYRTRTRLSSAIADYNRHRQQMPYRLIARLFNFKPIPQAT
jgi:hypothetical protein